MNNAGHLFQIQQSLVCPEPPPVFCMRKVHSIIFIDHYLVVPLFHFCQEVFPLGWFRQKSALLGFFVWGSLSLALPLIFYEVDVDSWASKSVKLGVVCHLVLKAVFPSIKAGVGCFYLWNNGGSLLRLQPPLLIGNHLGMLCTWLYIYILNINHVYSLLLYCSVASTQWFIWQTKKCVCCRPRHGSKLARHSMTSSRDMLDPMSERCFWDHVVSIVLIASRAERQVPYVFPLPLASSIFAVMLQLFGCNFGQSRHFHIFVLAACVT